MKILTWNMAGAGFHTLTTHDQAWAWLLEEAEFDIALLQEANLPQQRPENFASVIFQRRFSNSNMTWGNCVLSRSLSYEQFIPHVDPRWSPSVHGPALVCKPTGDGPWLINVHSNAKHVPEFDIDAFTSDGGLTCHSKRTWEIEVIAHELKKTVNQCDYILGGDLNSALLLDKVYNRSTNRTLWTNLEFQGFHDLRLPHFEAEQQTFFRPRTNPYQLDHFFGNIAVLLKTTRWEVLSEIATRRCLSDHAPVLIEVNL